MVLFLFLFFYRSSVQITQAATLPFFYIIFVFNFFFLFFIFFFFSFFNFNLIFYLFSFYFFDSVLHVASRVSYFIFFLNFSIFFSSIQSYGQLLHDLRKVSFSSFIYFNF